MEVSGYVYYSPNSCITDGDEDMQISGSGSGSGAGYMPITILAHCPMPNIPIILISNINNQDTEYACAKTDENGKYTFTDVDIGMYKIMEAFGFETTVTQSVVSFNNTKQPITTQNMIPKDPDIEYVLAHKFETFGGNRIVSITPNLIKISVKEGNIQDASPYPYQKLSSVDFRDAPQRCEALVISDFLQFQNAVIKGNNVITYADKGTFGTCTVPISKSWYFAGLYQNQSFSSFTYGKYSDTSPQDGSYTITNIAGSSTFERSWFDTADYSKGDESGRFMIVNGDRAGQAFFRETINIESNTVYLFSCWAMNIMRFQDSQVPKFAIRILDPLNGNLIYEYLFDEKNPMRTTQIPTWIQIGTILTPEDVLNKTNITIEFLSQGVQAAGNDYAIDDITVVALKRGVVARKLLNPVVENVELGKELTYLCILTNLNDDEDITHVMFKDLLQSGVIVKDNKIYVSCSNIHDYEVTVANISNPQEEVDDVGVDVGRILAEAVEDTDPYFIPLKLEKIPVGVTVIIKFTVLVNSVNMVPPYNFVKNRFRIQFLSELDSQDTSRPRTVASNEVVTPVIYPILNAQKSLSKVENGNLTPISQGGAVLDGSEVCYLIKITNTGKATAENISISDEFDEKFIYNFPNRPDCSIDVTTEITSPVNLQQSEQQVLCSEIFSYGDHGIEISNITVPAATGTENGECIIRIYGQMKL